ncbi:MAG: VOC family protein [Acidobacteriota bacterium]|nr:VOC family protein [Acidobacteriota bacterium]
MPEHEHKYSPVSVYLMVNDGNAALDFYRNAFAADVIETYPFEGKLGHATLRINGCDVMLSDEFPEELTGVRSPKSLGGTTCTVSLSVDDADAWFERAKAAGAAIVRPLKDEFYGRSGKLRDPFGHTWGIVGPAKKS